VCLDLMHSADGMLLCSCCADARLRCAVLRCAVQADLSTTLRCAGGWVRDKLMGRTSLVSRQGRLC